MITAKTNVSSLDTLSWKFCDVKRQIKVYTMATRLIKTTVVISLNPRPENFNPPTIARMTVDGLKGRPKLVEYNKLKKMYQYVCTANLVIVSIGFVKEQDYRVKHADDVVHSNCLLGDYYSMSEIFNIFIESAIHASPSNFDLYLRDYKLYSHSIFSSTILPMAERYNEVNTM